MKVPDEHHAVVDPRKQLASTYANISNNLSSLNSESLELIITGYIFLSSI
jgi:hypothetical protein